MKVALSFGALASLVAAAQVARAGGYDTPMLYSARHMGMGGTAIGYVRDPSALFHNPAGLAHTRTASMLGDFSLLLGGLHASPDPTAPDTDSNLTVAPFFLLGGAYRLNDVLTAGFGVYPVASAGATYHYGPPGYQDKTSLFFVEASPAIAVNLPANLRLGVGYRVTFAQLERFKGYPGRDPAFIDFTLRGFDFRGVRVGMQWTASEWLEVGVVYRHKTVTTVTNDTGVAASQTYQDVSTTLTLPSKLGAGARVDLEPFGPHVAFATDVEYGFNSQNQSAALSGTPAGGARVSVPNVFEWSDSVTLRVGGELRLWHDPGIDADRLALRAGYVFDGQVTNAEYPTAFGTPPGPTQVLTAGAGYNGGRWQANVAYGYRFGSGSVTLADLSAPGRKDCPFCSAAGHDDYSIHLNGIYVDASYDF